MATNIPPHNLGEVVDGTIAYIDNPDITIDELMVHIKGPDFPTAGILLGKSGIKEAYRTGRGRIKIRSKVEMETTKKAVNRSLSPRSLTWSISPSWWKKSPNWSRKSA